MIEELMMEKLKNALLAEFNPDDPYTNDPEYNASDYAGGNYDDCFTNGFDSGRSSLAKELLIALYLEELDAKRK
jgi:hypothetical protein